MEIGQRSPLTDIEKLFLDTGGCVKAERGQAEGLRTAVCGAAIRQRWSWGQANARGRPSQNNKLPAALGAQPEASCRRKMQRECSAIVIGKVLARQLKLHEPD